MRQNLPPFVDDFSESAKQALQRFAAKGHDALDLAIMVDQLRRYPRLESKTRLDALLRDLKSTCERLKAFQESLDGHWTFPPDPGPSELQDAIRRLERIVRTLTAWREFRKGKLLGDQLFRAMLSAFMLARTGKPHDQDVADLWTVVAPTQTLTAEAVRKAREDYAELLENLRRQFVEWHSSKNRT